jgi:multiple sugar transport system ATP-binding protein
VCIIEFSHVGKTYADGTNAVTDLNLEIADGELAVFVGPSGCGKTTALRMVAGLEEITTGEVRLDGRVVNDVPPKSRDIAMVFQNYALYPHMTVFENIAFPLRSRRTSSAEVRERVTKTAAQLGLSELLKRRPGKLSGGQRQRVAMGRAMVRRPEAFLMDEPLSNLDAKLRNQMRVEIRELQRELGVTTIYVTHDQVEAMTMGDRIIVMRAGVLQQQGAPEVLFNQPANLFIATFLGTPSMNLFEGTVQRDETGTFVLVGDQRLPVADGWSEVDAYLDQKVAVGLRPDDLFDRQDGDGAVLRGRVRLVETLGAEKLVHAELRGHPVVSDQVLEVAADMDRTVAEDLKRSSGDAVAPFIARVGADTAVQVGDVAEFSVRTHRLHLFDLTTGEAIARSALLHDAQYGEVR